MLCIDTSSLIAYLEGAQGADVDLITHAFSDGIGILSPVTVTEIMSDPQLSPMVRETILEMPVLPVIEGFWERAGLLRAKIQKKGRKARLADTLIAQCCLDHDATLVTRDNDFAIFKQTSGLKIV